MTDRSSSNRAADVFDAVVIRDQHSLGPVRLPDNRVDDFIDHFNRVYLGLGMRLAAVPPPPPEATSDEADASGKPDQVNEKIPGSLEATGDDNSASIGS
jgi:hypothetical protein